MIRVAILTISDSAVAGLREDRSGPALQHRVQELGWTVATTGVVADDVTGISSMLARLADSGEIDVILTSGGTGIAPRDVTPEVLRARPIGESPASGVLARRGGRGPKNRAPVARGGGLRRGATLIVSFPGSPRGAVDSFNTVAELIPHVVDLLHGRTEHNQKPTS